MAAGHHKKAEGQSLPHWEHSVAEQQAGGSTWALQETAKLSCSCLQLSWAAQRGWRAQTTHYACCKCPLLTLYSSRGPDFGLWALHLSFILLLTFYCALLCFPYTTALCLFQKQDHCSFSTVSPFSIPYFQWSPLGKVVTEWLRTADLQKKKKGKNQKQQTPKQVSKQTKNPQTKHLPKNNNNNKNQQPNTHTRKKEKTGCPCLRWACNGKTPHSWHLSLCSWLHRHNLSPKRGVNPSKSSWEVGGTLSWHPSQIVISIFCFMHYIQLLNLKGSFNLVNIRFSFSSRLFFKDII